MDRQHTGAAGPLLSPAPPPDLADRVEDRELARLLGYPDRRIPSGRVSDGVRQARAWYRRHGRPWARARRIPIEEIRNDSLRLVDGERLTTATLARRLTNGAATDVIVAAVGAGPEVDEECDLLWRRDRPDEAYFLDRLAAAAVEHLALRIGEGLRAQLGREGLGLLPSYSPGYHGWDLEQQGRVGRSLSGNEAAAPFEVLDSGMIRPRSSLLTVFGVTARTDLAAEAWRRESCSWCSLTSCGFRRIRSRPPALS